ncbi:hypothetical protein PIB30_078784 [Stylosanthes scabra]|uniref:Uncharacterized protein n=1 Tax=Stylosanthes scabra TaxID=79078 RepID=A0ABU6UQF1_9FABA|nr:hypothetical protein [Stylosanthes scabra]
MTEKEVDVSENSPRSPELGLWDSRYDLILTSVGLIAYGLYLSGLGLGSRSVTLPPLGSVGVVHSSE